MPSNPKNTRRCIVCREHADKSALIRFVKSVSGEIVVDDQKALNGRGVWVHNNDECIAKLVKKRMLNSAFKMNVGDEIYGKLDSKT